MSPKAGLFAGEVTPSAPADNSPTSKEKGYVWMEYGSVFEPTSTQSGVGGIASTQENFYPTTVVDFPHPFEGESFDQLTMSVICQQTTRVGTAEADHMSAFNFKWTGDQTRLKVSRNGFGTMFFSGSMGTDAASGAAAKADVGVSDVNWADWYWMGISYSNVSGPVGHMYVVNLRTGAETGGVITSDNSADITFPANLDGSIDSSVYYGFRGSAASTLEEPWLGYLSQMYIHNKYIDFSVAGNRRLFCALDGAIDYGDIGELPLGEQPLIYLPGGHPSQNVGTRFIGVWDDDFWINPIYAAGLPPPTGT